MTRPLRLEFPGAMYHVTARGDRRQAIFIDDFDREFWLELLGLVCKRFNFVVHAYCQMGNHYHIMLETIDGNLGQGMRQSGPRVNAYKITRSQPSSQPGTRAHTHACYQQFRPALTHGHADRNHCFPL